MKYRRIFQLLIVCLYVYTISAQSIPVGTANVMVASIRSPNKQIEVIFQLEKGKPFYQINYQGDKILDKSAIGLMSDKAEFSNQLKWLKNSTITEVNDSYQMVNAKKANMHYQANRIQISLSNLKGEKLNIIFQVSNDGVAFRYALPQQSNEVFNINEELTSFRFMDGTKAWLQPKAEAQSGWEHTNPSYEAHYMMDISTGTPAPGKNGWVYPAMFHFKNAWMLITEAALGRTYCGSSLQQFSTNNEYKINFPQSPEKYSIGQLYPSSILPMLSPWRIIAIGSLKTIMESTLGTDLALPAKQMDHSFIKPGRSSWSWIMSKDNFIVYDEQKKYIDYAADMHWEYCLIDVNWDTKIGYDQIKVLADYAATKNVGLLLWYNSAGDWNTVKYSPKGKLLTHQTRIEEFARIEKMGIKGIKVDFFAGDGQSMINYYQDILEDAATHHLLVNFHGATLPRGWQRTYPNLMTTEAVYGYEMITFNQKDADQAPAHMVMSAFARNVFDPMDFTPVSLDKIPRIIKKTNTAFEMATGVIFLSGIQHFVDGPAGMANMPLFVKNFMQNIPVIWDEVKFIDGYPGKNYVVARRAGKKWYVAGINADTSEYRVHLNLSFIKNPRSFTSYQTHPTSGELYSKKVAYTNDMRQVISLQTNDGFVLVFE